MAGIFISHSSVDKPFVNKLSLDLVNRGFPVWYDSWEISFADSLLDKIYNALDESFFLIVVLSKNSIKSKWVTKELNAALAKEDDLNRKFVLPIKIDDCEVPLKILDRVFLDFSNSYLRNLEVLDLELRKWYVHKIDIPLSKRLIPLNFLHYVDVDTSSIEKGYKDLNALSKEHPLINEDQLVILEEPVYKKLKEKLFDRIDNFEKDPYYSAELYRYLKSELDALKDYENKLKNGVCLILNNYGKPKSDYSLNEALHWFCKLMRSRILYKLWSVQIPKEHNSDLIEIDEKTRLKWRAADLISDRSAANFFEVISVRRLLIGNPGLGYGGVEDFSFWMDENSYNVQEFLKNQFLPENAGYILDTEAFSKYLIPQMLAYVAPQKYIWTIKDKVIALS